MQVQCPRCLKDSAKDLPSSRVVRSGSFYRSSDARKIQRFLCLICGKSFSFATFNACYRQKKRHKNEPLRIFLSSTGSMRRAAIKFNLHRTTVERKFRFLGMKREELWRANNEKMPKATQIEFDDMETFEHTKCKPLSITLAVETKSRRILAIEVSQMPAKGHLVKKARKYGYRPDERAEARRRLFQRLKDLLQEDCIIKSDQNPHYRKEVREFFPKAHYKQFKGQRGSLSGQGELKKVGFDPLFSLNHTCAMMRANVNRLLRKTWCTTKKVQNLRAHLMIYADYHNSVLLNQ